MGGYLQGAIVKDQLQEAIRTIARDRLQGSIVTSNVCKGLFGRDRLQGANITKCRLQRIDDGGTGRGGGGLKPPTSLIVAYLCATPANLESHAMGWIEIQLSITSPVTPLEPR